MSGFEIAGLVLGAFPLLISAAEHYKKGFEPLRHWVRFRSEFLDFIDAVDIEKSIFDATLEEFLISADVPHEELQLLMTDPNYVGWHSEDLVNVLRSRLGHSDLVFKSTIRTLNQTLADLQDMLLPNNGEVNWATDDASKWEYELKRISHSFSNGGERAVKRLESTNEKLRRLFTSHERLQTSRSMSSRKVMKWGHIFECIRCHASSVHMALRKGWNCSCEKSHSTALRLERRHDGGWSSEFYMAFDIQTDHVKPLDIRREVLIRTRKEDVKVDVPSMAPGISGLQPVLNQLRRDFEPESKSSPQVNVMPHPPLKSTSSETPSSISSHVRSVFSRNSSIGSSTIISTSNATGVLHADTGSSRLRIPHRSKPKKSVGFRVETQQVTFVPKPEPCQPQPIQPEVTTEIKDLCSVLKSPNMATSCFGYLCDDEDHHHEIIQLFDKPQAMDETKSVSLEQLIGNRKLNRQQRFIIATILASSLIQLGTTPWMTQKMEKRSIFFNQTKSKVDLEHPYIRHSFPSSKQGNVAQENNGNPPITRFATKESLANLGILLLELCFDQPVESCISWGNYLVNGIAHNKTDYLTAREWVDSVGGQEPDLEPIIRCCVNCSFERPADWGDKSFVQAVYSSIVAPLEKIVTSWAA
ncbi:hypothetical protein HYFRA_00012205 [Hymenoscyphus fraxineus]|uniref:DUF7580 domain-containing protein n=1 Tax=Hymenoscyphus fraxineus TaxID=746836 RepID=A0A9N9PR98_9HELO|nr:hypothetical protein HYFRA_00012205 [Hymenoscyphus fraxineus]